MSWHGWTGEAKSSSRKTRSLFKAKFPLVLVLLLCSRTLSQAADRVRGLGKRWSAGVWVTFGWDFQFHSLSFHSHIAHIFHTRFTQRAAIFLFFWEKWKGKFYGCKEGKRDCGGGLALRLVWSWCEALVRFHHMHSP